MANVVAGMYEIEQQIGSGGGGVVYLGRHLRLNKLVVLKADKRSLNTKPEVLRREVDMLKGLSHTYIPQVYDFIQEDGIVYTVMDFIDGESLDKILKRGQTPPQSQLIQWACQILEALCYLHSRPPHGILHGDIKPANIMLRPNGDICLIDYNIALALGENGAVKVRYSIGYASPEHYGMDSAAAGSSRLRDGVPAAASLPSRPPGSSGAETGSKAGRSSMMLDVRSDILQPGSDALSPDIWQQAAAECVSGQSSGERGVQPGSVKNYSEGHGHGPARPLSVGGGDAFCVPDAS